MGLDLPLASLLSFPLEFQQGMRARGDILGDTGRNGPDNWDPVWRENSVHVWLAVNALHSAALDERCAAMRTDHAGNRRRPVAPGTGCRRRFRSRASSATRSISAIPMASAIPISKAPKEESSRPGQTDQGRNWQPLATGEFLLGYADEAGELPVAPIPHLLGRNGTFMVYRKLHQNVATFRAYLDERSRHTRAARKNSPPSLLAAGATARLSNSLRSPRSRPRRRSQPQH